jgi:hypothetical protein
MDGKEDKSADTLAMVAGLIAAVKLARVDSAEGKPARPMRAR